MSEPLAVAGKGLILAVDDTAASLKLLTEILKAEGYEVRSAINGELALRAAALQPPDLMLLDIRMPGIDGFEVCRRIKADPHTRDVPVIFLSALSDADEKVRGFELGAVDYVTKPYQRQELLARVRTHLELSRLRRHLEEIVEERTQLLWLSERKLRNSLFDSISAIAAIIEIRDPYTAGHQQRVAQIAVAIAGELGISEHGIEGLRLAASVHDVGKIHIPTEILSRPGRLNTLEFDLVKEHVNFGREILRSIDFPWPITDTVFQHHERLDGSGYPLGLKDEQILPEAKILAVADVVEAMSSHRPYRASLGVEAALDEISNKRGIAYCPDVVDVCLRLFREKGFRTGEAQNCAAH